jgi:hypothetical protein
MQYGTFCWTKNSSRLMFLVLQCYAAMDSSVEFTCTYSHIRQTILKSMYKISVLCSWLHAHVNWRALLAAICELGLWPCSTCKIPKHKLAEMGTKRSLRKRMECARVDNNDRYDQVQCARNLVYGGKKNSVAVNSIKVERLLKSDSLTLTEVSMRLQAPYSLLSDILKECIFKETPTLSV